MVTPVAAQNTAPDLDDLLARAAHASPALLAARARVDEARARVAPASTRADPMLMAGVQNLSLGDPVLRDPMTMTMVGVSQRLPWPGRLRLQRRIAEHELVSAEHSLAVVQRSIERDVRTLWYEIAHLDRVGEIVEQNRRTLLATITATEARYAVGQSAQSEVLRARMDAVRLGDAMSSLLEERLALLARLNALLDRPADAPVGRATIPQRLTSAASADSVRQIRFVSPSLGGRAADSPLPGSLALQELAIVHSPELAAHEAMLAARVEQLRLAEREHLPDVDVTMSYGFRSGRPDMISATVALPLPLQRALRQDQRITEARAALLAITSEHHEQVNLLRADVARHVAEAERARTRLALYRRAVLPQSRALFESMLAAYESGRADLPDLLEAQSTVFENEIAVQRALADFVIAIARLENLIGKEILQ